MLVIYFFLPGVVCQESPPMNIFLKKVTKIALMELYGTEFPTEYPRISWTEICRHFENDLQYYSSLIH